MASFMNSPWYVLFPTNSIPTKIVLIWCLCLIGTIEAIWSYILKILMTEWLSNMDPRNTSASKTRSEHIIICTLKELVLIENLVSFARLPSYYPWIRVEVRELCAEGVLWHMRRQLVSASIQTASRLHTKVLSKLFQRHGFLLFFSRQHYFGHQ